MHHIPVMGLEMLEFLAIEPNGIYIDATFGRGGHSQVILEQLGSEGFLLGIDKDPAAVERATELLCRDARFIFEKGSFAKMTYYARARDWMGKVSGIVFDLGVSSPQLETPERGFSFMRDGPLDMRMDPSCGLAAKDWLAKAKEKEIADVLWELGEERFARRIAKAIVQARKITPITRTLQLAGLMSGAMPHKHFSKHPATRSFQAIRIFINQELCELKQGLMDGIELLKIGGRLIVISFHSLEARIIKQCIKENVGKVRLIAKQCVSKAEITKNPRSRSAVMRVLEKIACV